LGLVPLARAGTWNLNGNGNWTPAGNWSGGAPNGVGDAAIFGTVITAPRTVTLNSGRTVGSVVFDSAHSYTVGNSTNTLTLDVSSGSVTITVNSGSGSATHTISSPLSLNDALIVTNNATGLLNFDLSSGNALSGTNRNLTFAGGGDITVADPIATGTGTLTKNGSGKLTLSGVNTFTGKTVINAGSVRIGAETGLGNNPGSFAADQLTFDGGTLHATASLTIDDANRGLTLLGGGGEFEAGSGITLTISNVITGSGGLSKADAGTLALGANNTFTGGLTIKGGIVRLDHAGALNSATPNAVSFSNSSTGTLRLNGQSVTVSGLNSGTPTGAPLVENASATAATLTVNQGSGTSTFAGVLQNGAGGGALSLTKSGSGTLVLSGANTYTGATTVSGGELVLASTGSLASPTTVQTGATLSGTGTISGNVTAQSGGSLVVATSGTAGTFTVGGASALSLNGGSFGYFDLGGTTLGSYDRVVAPSATLLANGAIHVTLIGAFAPADGDAFQLFQAASYGGSPTFDFSGAVLAPGLAWDTSLFLTSGTIRALSASGTIWDTNGTTAGSGNAGGNWSQAFWSSSAAGTAGTGTIQNGGTATFSAGTDGVGPFTVQVDVSQNVAGITFEEGGVTLADAGGTLTLTSSSIDVQSALQTATVDAPLAGTVGLTKLGPGTLVLGGINTFSGGVNVPAGVLALGASHVLPDGETVTVTGPGSLDRDGNSDAIGALNLNGGAVSGGGTLTLGGSVTSTGTSSLGGGATNLGGVTRTFDVTGTLAASDQLTSGGLTKLGSGTLELSGTSANTYAGSTTVSAGTLTLNKTGATAIAGDLAIGDGTGVDTVQLLQGNQIADTAAVTIQASGVLDRNGQSDAIGALNLNGGAVSGAGTLTLGGTVTSTGTSSLGGGATNLGGGQTFDVTGTLSVGDVLSGGQLTKEGPGLLVLSNPANSHGGTVVNNGTAQGYLGGNSIDVSGGTADRAGTNQSVTAITLDNSSLIDSVGTSTLVLDGNVSSTGASTLSGGMLDLNGGTRIFDVLTGTLGVLTPIQNGGLTKNGAGTLELLPSTASSYSGATSINAGVVRVASDGALGSGAAGTTVANGAALELAGGVGYATAESLSLDGAGIGALGALRVVDGSTVTWAGAVGLANHATIGVYNGSELELHGTVTKNGTVLKLRGDGPGNVIQVYGGVVGALPGSDLVVDNVSVNIHVPSNYNGPTLVENGGVLQIAAAGSLTTTAVTVGGSGPGTLTQSGGDLFVSGNVAVHAGSSYTLSGGALDFGDQSNGASVLSIDPAATFNFTGGRLIDLVTLDPGGGTFTQAGGTLVVGRDSLGPPVSMSILAGGFAQSGGILALDIFGPAAFDLLQVTGPATLEGILAANFVGYLPAGGATFDIVHTMGGALAFLGSFASNVLGAELSIVDDGFGGQFLRVRFPSGSVTPTPAVPEPSAVLTWLVAGIAGLWGTAWRARRRRRGDAAPGGPDRPETLLPGGTLHGLVRGMRRVPVPARTTNGRNGQDADRDGRKRP